MSTCWPSANRATRCCGCPTTFSKIEAPKTGLIPDVFNLREMLEDAMKSLAVSAHRKHLELAFRVAPNLPETLIGDAGRLRQIVVNLVGNAIKFTQSGVVVLDVSRAENGDAAMSPAGTVVTPTIVLHFYVRDTGIGIAPEKQAFIIEALEQADTSTTRYDGGTGLGLAISQRLVRLMGGRIWVDSELGIGSTFHFTAKLVVPPVSLKPPVAALEELPPMRILLAEDNLANQKLVVGMLTEWGHYVTVANNGAEALRAWAEPPENRPFDVVLMDVQMPKMDGFETTAAIRDRERSLGRHTPIVAMTAHTMKGDRERCLAAGMDGHIAKPIHQQEVVAVLRQSLAGEIGLFRLTAEQDALAPVDDDPKHTAATGTRHLNWTQALRFVANDQDLLSEVLAAFVDEYPDLQARLRQAAATEDWLTVAKTAHKLQAALRLIGGDSFELAITLDDRCKRGGPDESLALFEKFSGELENVLVEVQGYLRDS